jgi:biopolymer transport protein ExbB
MKTQQEKKVKKSQGVSSGLVIAGCAVLAILFFMFVAGNPSNFAEGNPKGHPLPGNFFGTLYKGGFIIPMVLTLLFTVVVLSVERYFALNRARGKNNLFTFVQKVKAKLEEGDIKGAHVMCDEQEQRRKVRHHPERN